MKLEYEKMTDDEFQAVQDLVKQKLSETNRFLRQVCKAKKQLWDEGYPPSKSVKGQVQYFDLPLEQHPAFKATIGIYRFREIGLAELRRELEGMRLEINVEKKRRGKR